MPSFNPTGHTRLDSAVCELETKISDTRDILLELRRKVDNLETMAMGSYGPSPSAAPTAEEAREAFSHLTAASAVVTVTRPELPLCSELNRAASILRAFIEAHDE